MKLADALEFTDGAYYLRLATGRFQIPEESSSF
jgi:hypothetical protein